MFLEYAYMIKNHKATGCMDKYLPVVKRVLIKSLPDPMQLLRITNRMRKTIPDFVIFNDVSVWSINPRRNIKTY